MNDAHVLAALKELKFEHYIRQVRETKEEHKVEAAVSTSVLLLMCHSPLPAGFLMIGSEKEELEEEAERFWDDGRRADTGSAGAFCGIAANLPGEFAAGTRAASSRG